jgi:hypothetical protein
VLQDHIASKVRSIILFLVPLCVTFLCARRYSVYCFTYFKNSSPSPCSYVLVSTHLDVLRSNVSDPDSIRSGDLYPDPDPGGQNWPTKIEKIKKVRFEVLDVLFCVRKASSVVWTYFVEA